MTEWVEIGGARLACGDAREILAELPQGSIDALITDPPYSSGGAFRADRVLATGAKYTMTGTLVSRPDFAGDNRDQRSYAFWASTWLAQALRISNPGAVCAVFTDWRQLPTTTDALQAGGWIWRGIGVWDKTEAARPDKGRYRNQCEYFAWGSAGPMTVEGDCHPGVFRASALSEEKHHIAGKPVAILHAISKIAKPRSTICDPFMGSGTGGVAAARADFRYIGIELEPRYFDIACRRIEEAYKQADLFVEQPAAPKPEQADLLA